MSLSRAYLAAYGMQYGSLNAGDFGSSRNYLEWGSNLEAAFIFPITGMFCVSLVLKVSVVHEQKRFHLESFLINFNVDQSDSRLLRWFLTLLSRQ